MAYGLGLFGDGDMVLAVGSVESAVAFWSAVAFAAPLVQEELGLVEVFFVTGDAIELAESDLDFQLAESDLDFLVARRVGAVVCVERAADQVGVFRGDVEESPSYMWPTQYCSCFDRMSVQRFSGCLSGTE